ncbi:adenosylcobinamide-phosphate synthase CbiB [Roseomonas harenae]|uniref:adenosylcobinamide-phosphate synthase CbiB n=1 Tax=Muricoccus harenae TaxID=2692566 RepID=UPI00133130CB|nr:adenosylcobinamide-phosphate synthase CbiB [Roseomonas harenae]
MTLTLAALALLTEAAFGYPDRVFRSIGHPVTWIGSLIAALDRWLNRPGWDDAARRAAGVATLLLLLAATILPALALETALRSLSWGLLPLVVLACTLPAQRSLHDHVARVAAALERDGLEAGRVAVSHIVGRDTAVLDEAGVARAAIESLAENASDGVVAPAFWLAAFGLAGGVAYKAVNTADSMIGHRTPRHASFGWAAARFDDLVNLPASRLSAALVIAAAAILPGADPRAAWRAVWRDARHHRSPNAGWPEAAMAGALGLSLAGPRRYGGVMVVDAAMGDGRREADAADIRKALRLFRVADALLVGGLVLLAWITA